TVEGITQYTLANGLRVLLFPDQSKPTTTVNITYLVGSRFEGYGETGMAHLLEHMLFKGSTRHRNIPQELTEHGSNPNGTTWFDRTNYFETFQASDSNLVWALDLEADRMVNSFIAKKDLDKEFTVVRNEFELGENSPFNILMERVLSTMFLWHNYGHSTIGARSDIENVPIERLQAFYHKYYQPDNAVLVIGGKFDPARALQLVQQKLGRIPRPRRIGDMRIWPTYTRDPVQDGERSVTLRRTGDVQVVMAAYHVPGGAHPDFAGVDVLTRILGDQPSGRLYKALVETKKAAQVGAFNFQLKEPGMLLAYDRVPKDDSIAPAQEALEQAVAGAVTDPPTDAEVARAKTQLLKNFDLMLNNSEDAALNLTEWAAIGDWRLMFLHRDRVKAVTTADVQRVAAAYLKQSNATYGTFIPTEKPDRAEIPPDPDVVALVKDYKGDTTLAVGEVFDASPANIDRRTERTELPGGLKLALLPKKTRGEAVNARIALHFGTAEAVQGKSVVADMAADMLMRGTTAHTRQQIKDEFDRLKAQVNVSGGATGVNVRIQTVRENLIPVLKLVGEVLRQPSFDPKEFDELQRANLSSLEENKSQPTALASNALNRYLNPYPKGDPRYTPTFEESIADYRAATVDDARAFYAGFYGADHGEMAVVGDFDPAEVKTQAAAMFGDWKSPAPYQRVEREYHDLAANAMTIETPDKANAMFLAGLNLPVRDDDRDYPALTMANEMLGGGFLNSRLATRIRQKDGVSYGVGSFLRASPLDSAGQFITYAIAAPENMGKVESDFREEVDRARSGGFTTEEFDKARQGYLQNQDVNRSDDRALVGELVQDLYVGRTMAYDAAFEANIGKLGVDQ
ncbi:MAG TPA: pitrilysin family protein, partial [Gemmatimonadales bacterium]|nr:pitrilysin family protein [Gemmatimonadales bacterium]